jgi:hypothetical protein
MFLLETPSVIHKAAEGEISRITPLQRAASRDIKKKSRPDKEEHQKPGSANRHQLMTHFFASPLLAGGKERLIVAAR